HRRLNGLEWQVWEYTDGSVSLKEIAKQLRISVKQVQQIVFRLIAVGLVEEVPFWGNSLSSPAQETLPEQLLELLEKEYISYSFLEDLAGFLDNQF
ncbi:MAG TPA: helix-turn-helix domain-containing protein, partial [Cyanophyceae cyanobacterium]